MSSRTYSIDSNFETFRVKQIKICDFGKSIFFIELLILNLTLGLLFLKKVNFKEHIFLIAVPKALTVALSTSTFLPVVLKLEEHLVRILPTIHSF